jgi:uncharacterized membrane protein YbhN (UPF0104 family)
VAYCADFMLRAARFWWLLEIATSHRLPFLPTVGPFIASFGVSDILPLRVGDGFRIVWFHQRFAIPLGVLTGMMIVERILDLVTIVILGAFSLLLTGGAASSALLGSLGIALAVAMLSGIGLLFGPPLLALALEKCARRVPALPVGRLIAFLSTTSEAQTSIGSWRRWLALSVISLTVWLLESATVIGAWLSLGGGTGAVLKPFLAFSFSTLGTMVPSLPGHFGPFEFFGLRAFALTNVDTAFAAAVLFLAHLILWFPTALIGIGWLLAGNAGRSIGTAISIPPRAAETSDLDRLGSH